MSQQPPTTASSEPVPTIPRPRSRRPRTAVRPGTARPDTSASGISAEELPDQQFFPEDDGFDEDEEYDEEGTDDEGVFAFDRPKTGAVAKQEMSEYGTSAPATGMTGMTEMTGMSRATGVSTFSGASSSMPPLTGDTDGRTYATGTTSPRTDTAGAVEAGGRVPELAYDGRHAPFSGRNNPNNSAFAFSISSRNRGKTASTAGPSTYAGTSSTSLDSDAMGAHPGPRRMKSNAPLIPSTAGTDFSTQMSQTTATTDRGQTRGSIGMTEMTGDMTVPDGKTTWGDGQGGVLKDISEQGEDVNLAEYDLEEDSPYPEVRASVSNIDDPDMPSLTFRAWFMGLIFAILGAGINTFFHFRNPSPYLNSLIIQVVAYPCGKILARIMPIGVYRNPRWLGGHEWSLNPGPFNIKEHCIITIMSNVSLTPAYGLSAIVSSELWYQRPLGIGFNILFVLSTQITGFSLAGICRRFVVWPASMIWPGVLMMCTNLNTLHAEDEGFQGGITRFRFLVYTSVGAFLFYILPGYLFTALSYFSWMCWIAPTNKYINQIFGVSTGLGASVLVFDWSQITWLGNPLVIPWWALANVGFIFVLFYWIIVPIMFYTNTWYTGYIPINVQQVVDRFGQPYDILAVLNQDRTLNTTAYAEYSPVYLSATYNLTYIASYALVTSLITHTILFHGPRIYRAIINVKTEPDDIHAKLMRRYPAVPIWWYTVALCLFGGVFAIVAVEVYDTGLPVWAYLVAILLASLYILPSAFIFAMTAQPIAINLIAQLIPGYVFPGQPIPCMLFKVFAMQTLQESQVFVQDMKFGHYIKIPPRHTFIAQMSAVVVACFAQVGTKTLLFNVVPDMCAPLQANLLTCARTKVFFTSTIIWGLIGPGRLFSIGTMYHPQTFAALAGAIAPIPIWLCMRKWPRSIMRNVSIPVGLNGVLYMPPATGINYASWILVGAVFQFWIRRRRFAWWSKYNYVLASALDVGTALSALLIFLAFRLPQLDVNWWGNLVYTNVVDWNGDGAQLYTPPEEGFGPTTWKV